MSLHKLREPRQRQRPGAFRGALLWLLCLATFTVRQADELECCTECVREAQAFLKYVKERNFDCSLYTPPLDGYVQNCPNSTFLCLAAEVKVLMTEGKVEKSFTPNGRDLAWRLRSLIDEEEDKDDCSACEVHPENAAEKFLEDLLSILESMNSRLCVL